MSSKKSGRIPKSKKESKFGNRLTRRIYEEEPEMRSFIDNLTERGYIISCPRGYTLTKGSEVSYKKGVVGNKSLDDLFGLVSQNKATASHTSSELADLISEMDKLAESILY